MAEKKPTNGKSKSREETLQGVDCAAVARDLEQDLAQITRKRPVTSAMIVHGDIDDFDSQ